MTGGAARAFATREACVRSGCTGGASTDASARTEGQFLQRFYEPYELTFFTRQPWRADADGLPGRIRLGADERAQVGEEEIACGLVECGLLRGGGLLTGRDPHLRRQRGERSSSLMTQFAASNACLPGLTDKEVDVLRTTGGMIDASCGWNELFVLRDSVVRAVLARR